MTRMQDKKYTALYRTVKEQILSGRYRAGEKLPSKRVMADRAGVSLITVEKAYAMLTDEGYILAKERQGYFAALPDFPGAQTGHDPAPLPHLPVPEGECGGGVSHAAWFRTVRRVMATEGDRLFRRAPAEGCAVLRNAIADYLLRYRGMRAEPGRIVIGSGAEQLYESVVKLLGREKLYAIENPCYRQIRAVYRSMGVHLSELKLGEDGILPEELAKPFDVLHVTPFHSFPSGVSTSAGKRYAYLRRAEAGCTVVEDDFDSEFFAPGHPVESLYAMDTGGHVIYMNTFSKSISPAVRVGYMILPDGLLPTYRRLFGGLSCSVPVMDQYVLASFIDSGDFERHLNRMRRKMKKD